MTVPIAQPSAVGGARAPSIFQCFAVLAGIKLGLLLLGFRSTYRFAAWCTRSREAVCGGREAVVTTSGERVAAAAAFFPGRALCLERSLALFVLLRCMGTEATLRLGVRAYPFAAHAWIEHGGEPVNENRETLAAYAPFPELPERMP